MSFPNLNPLHLISCLSPRVGQHQEDNPVPEDIAATPAAAATYRRDIEAWEACDTYLARLSDELRRLPDTDARKLHLQTLLQTCGDDIGKARAAANHVVMEDNLGGGADDASRIAKARLHAAGANANANAPAAATSSREALTSACTTALASLSALRSEVALHYQDKSSGNAGSLAGIVAACIGALVGAVLLAFFPPVGLIVIGAAVGVGATAGGRALWSAMFDHPAFHDSFDPQGYHNIGPLLQELRDKTAVALGIGLEDAPIPADDMLPSDVRGERWEPEVDATAVYEALERSGYDMLVQQERASAAANGSARAHGAGRAAEIEPDYLQTLEQVLDSARISADIKPQLVRALSERHLGLHSGSDPRHSAISDDDGSESQFDTTEWHPDAQAKDLDISETPTTRPDPAEAKATTLKRMDELLATADLLLQRGKEALSAWKEHHDAQEAAGAAGPGSAQTETELSAREACAEEYVSLALLREALVRIHEHVWSSGELHTLCLALDNTRWNLNGSSNLLVILEQQSDFNISCLDPKDKEEKDAAAKEKLETIDALLKSFDDTRAVVPSHARKVGGR